ncbi:MAG: hypothetical protein LW834_21605, partial [Cyanobium sp. 49614_E6]|nr:hypothetical protein [Cyanobium sp. 49614_E6]
HRLPRPPISPLKTQQVDIKNGLGHEWVWWGPHSSLPEEAGKLDWGVTAIKKPCAVQGLGG